MGSGHADGRDDAALLAQTVAGDYAAFEELVNRYHGPVYRLALQMTQDALDAEEVAQEAFLNVFKHARSFRGGAQVGTWIHRIAVNAALMRLRSKRRKPSYNVEDYAAFMDHAAFHLGSNATELLGRSQGNQQSWAAAPDDQMLGQELRSHLSQAIAKLPDKYRLVLLLRDVEGYSNDQVAEALGLTVPTVKARLHRARLFVRQELALYFTTSPKKARK